MRLGTNMNFNSVPYEAIYYSAGPFRPEGLCQACNWVSRPPKSPRNSSNKASGYTKLYTPQKLAWNLKRVSEQATVFFKMALFMFHTIFLECTDFAKAGGNDMPGIPLDSHVPR